MKQILFSGAMLCGAAFMCAAVVSCSRKATDDYTVTVKNNIGFNIELNSSWSDASANATIAKSDAVNGNYGSDCFGETRATPVTTLYSTFNVWAYSYAGSWTETLTPNLIDCEAVSKVDGVWRTADPHAWPGAGVNVRFFAYAPVTLDGLTVTAAAGTPKLDYTVPADVADQLDLLTASADAAGDSKGSVKLTFKHALTAVKFVTGNQILSDGIIKKVTLKGVYGKGTYSVGATSWTGWGSVMDFTQVLNVATDGTSDAVITAADQTFIMIPQTLPAGAAVEIEIEDAKGKTRTRSASIAGKTWPMGSAVKYRISTKNDTLTFDVEITDWDAEESNRELPMDKGMSGVGVEVEDWGTETGNRELDMEQ
ncbi:MAG: fimbrillin family protein [Alistipes sp.]|nr:fimbrillin family protein [Alistipes sp.]